MKTSTAIALGAMLGLAVGLTVPFTCWRYRFEVANSGLDKLHVPVFVRFDRYTGQSWIAAGREGKWRRFEDVDALAEKYDRDDEAWMATNHWTEADYNGWGITNK